MTLNENVGEKKKNSPRRLTAQKCCCSFPVISPFTCCFFFFKEIDWKLQPLESTELIGLPVKSNTFLVFFSYVCVCFRAQHLLVVTDSGKSQHRIRLNCGGEKGVRGGKERGLSIIWKLCGIFSILCTHWSLSCLPTGRRTAGGLLTSLAKYLSVPTVTIGLLTRGSDSRGKEFYIVSPPSQ